MLPLIALGTMLVYTTIRNRGPFDRITWQVILTVLIFSIPLLTISIWIYTRLFPLRLTHEGIQGHNERGRKKQLLWSDIYNVGTIRSGGLLCHKLGSKSSDSYLLVPTFLKNYQRCRSILLEHGIDLDKPTVLAGVNKPVVKPPARRAPQPQFEPIREGKYIVITTERSREKQY